MRYIVLDLEWNQASVKAKECEKLHFEVIEIGAIKMDETGKLLSEFSCLIQPQVYPQLFSRVKEVVQLTEQELEQRGIPFPQAFAAFVKWCEKDYVFATWGSMDLMELQRNMEYYGLENPFPFPFYFYDVQKLYSIAFQDGRERSALETAVAAEPFLAAQGEAAGHPFHRAVSDAWYTAQLLRRLPMERMQSLVSVDYFRIPQRRKDEIYLIFDSYAKYVSREYESREEAMENQGVNSLVCYRCGHNVRKRLNWFVDHNRHYRALGYCPEHGWLKGKIRMKKTSGERVFAVKTVKLIEEEEAQELLRLQRELREKRRQRRLEKEMEKETEKKRETEKAIGTV